MEYVPYPMVPSEEKIKSMNDGDDEIVGKDITISRAASKVLKEMRIIEANREIREALIEQVEGDTDTLNDVNGSKIISHDTNSAQSANILPNTDAVDTCSRKSDIKKLKDSKASLARDMSKKPSNQSAEIDTANISHQDVE